MNHLPPVSSPIAPSQVASKNPQDLSQIEKKPLLCRKTSIRRTSLTVDLAQQSIESRPRTNLQSYRSLRYASPLKRTEELTRARFVKPRELPNIFDEQASSSSSSSDQTSSASSDATDHTSAACERSTQGPILLGEKLLTSQVFGLEDTVYHNHQESIQTFLGQTQEQLIHYFSSINNTKLIEIDEIHPSFIAMPMTERRIAEVARIAFADRIYSKDDPRDGCYARAELAALELDLKSQTAGKIFVTGDNLCLSHPDYKNVAWRYHVAAAAVSEKGTLLVVDPCVSEKPMLLHQWLEKFVAGDAVKLTFTHANYRHSPPTEFAPIKGSPSERMKKAIADLNYLAEKGYASDSSEVAGHASHLDESGDDAYDSSSEYDQGNHSFTAHQLNLLM